MERISGAILPVASAIFFHAGSEFKVVELRKLPFFASGFLAVLGIVCLIRGQKRP